MSWHVVQTRPHQEPRAAENIARLGFDAFLPFLKKTRRVGRRVAVVNAPVFPSYLFVSLDLSGDAWGVINNAYGVRRILSDGRTPLRLPDGFVPGLQATIGEDGACAANADPIRPGDEVRIMAGPFADRIATVFDLAPGDRVRLLLGLLGGDVMASVDRRDVALTNGDAGVAAQVAPVRYGVGRPAASQGRTAEKSRSSRSCATNAS